jgi:coenzyme PQQ precursor peptide PqqA
LLHRIAAKLRGSETTARFTHLSLRQKPCLFIRRLRCLWSCAIVCRLPVRERRNAAMRKSWKKPRVVELAVGLEINSYACPEI